MKRIEFDLGLSDEDFWTNYLASENEALKKFRFISRHMTRIGAPKVLDLNLRKTFPLVIYQNGKPKDHYYYDLESSGLIVTIDVERNRLNYSVALERPDNKIPRTATKEQTHTVLANHMVDLKSRLSLDLKPGKYVTVIINRDDVSNQVSTVVKAKSGFYKDDEVEQFIKKHRKKALIPEIWPPLKEKPKKPPFGPLPLPIYAKREDSPDTPETTGISVKMTRMRFSGSDDIYLVQGSFRLPSVYGKFMPPEQRLEDNCPTEYMRMPIYLIVTGEKSANPFVGRMMIPVCEEVKNRSENKPVTGNFAFDLMKYANLFDSSQTYFIYFFSGEVMTGPCQATNAGEPSNKPGKP